MLASHAHLGSSLEAPAPTLPGLRAPQSGYSGAYWEAAVLKKSGNRYEVEYDNGDAEKVSHEHIFPADVPVGFGKDVDPPIRVRAPLQHHGLRLACY